MPANTSISWLRRLDLVAVLRPRSVVLALIVAAVIGALSIVQLIATIADTDRRTTPAQLVAVALAVVIFGLALRAWRRRPATRAWIDQLRQTSMQ